MPAKKQHPHQELNPVQARWAKWVYLMASSWQAYRSIRQGPEPGRPSWDDHNVAIDPGRNPLRDFLPGPGRRGELRHPRLLLFAVKEALTPLKFGSFDLGQYFHRFFTGVFNYFLARPA